MADSYLLQVEKKLTNLIASEVTTANGTPFDLANVVFRGRQRYGRSDPIPMVSILQAPNIDVQNENAGDGRMRQAEKTYLIQGWVVDDPVNPTDPAHELMAEVKRALAKVLDMDDTSYMLEGYLSSMNISTGLVRPAETGISDNAYFWLPVVVTLTENLSDPYSLPV